MGGMTLLLRVTKPPAATGKVVTPARTSIQIKGARLDFSGSGRLDDVIRVIQKLEPGPYLGRQGPD
jgi:hypothetical protein